MPITIQTVSEVPECPFWYGIYSNQALLDRIIICSSHKSKELMFFPVNIRARPLTRLHEISTARDWFQILLCPKRTHICFLRDGTFFKFPQSILTANLVHMAFFSQFDVIKTSSKPHCSWSSGRIFEGPQFPKLRLLRCPNFLRPFLPFVWVLPAPWPRAAAPEAEHRCTGQPSEATIPWPSGSSRRRRTWMRRTITAMASEEDIGGEISRGLGIPLWSEWRCWWFKFFGS